MTSSATAVPAGTMAHQAPALTAERLKACSMIVPHVTTLESDRPRKASAVSLKIATVMASTQFAAKSGPICGRMWRRMMCRCPAPLASARRTKTRSRMDLTCERISRATEVHIRRPMTSTT